MPTLLELHVSPFLDILKPQFFNFGDLKIMLKWENDNLQNNIQGPTM